MGEAARQLPGDIIDFDRTIRYMPAKTDDAAPEATDQDAQPLATVTDLPTAGSNDISEANLRVIDWAAASALDHQTLPAGYAVTGKGHIISPANLAIIDWAASTGQEDQPVPPVHS